MAWQDKTKVTNLATGDLIIISQSGVTKTTDLDSLIALVEGEEKSTMFGYSIPDEKTFTKADTWYKLEGVFTNEIVNNFSAGTNGIVFDGSGDTDLEAEYMFGGISDTAAIYKIALVKNGTFDETTEELTDGSILDGSDGGAEAIVLAGSRGFVNCRGFWAGTLTTDDEITIVYRSDEAGAVLTPSEASATIHRLF